MILFALAFSLISIFLVKLRLFPIAVILFFVVFDMFDGFYKDEKVFAAIRYVIPLTLLVIYIIKCQCLKKADLFLFIYIFYLLVLWLNNTGDFMLATRVLLAIILSIMMVPVGRYIGRKRDFIEEFEPYNRLLLGLIPVYIIIANILGIGDSYTDAFTTGFLITSRMYVVPIIIFLSVHYFIFNKKNSFLIKSYDIVFILINISILLINTRRTALGMLAVAILVYVFFNRQLIFKVVVFLIFIIAGLIVSYPLYEERLTIQLERRERIQNLDTYEEEGRYLETLYLFEYFTSQDNIKPILFGVKLFDTYDFGIKYFGTDRPIHSDINMMIYSTGLIGFILFIVFVFRNFLYNVKIRNRSDKGLYFAFLSMFVIVLIPGRFIGTLTFAPLLMLLLSAIKQKEILYRKLLFFNPSENDKAIV
jgi:hypothetical protein